jgi:hypothetical protein
MLLGRLSGDKDDWIIAFFQIDGEIGLLSG